MCRGPYSQPTKGADKDTVNKAEQRGHKKVIAIVNHSLDGDCQTAGFMMIDDKDRKGASLRIPLSPSSFHHCHTSDLSYH